MCALPERQQFCSAVRGSGELPRELPRLQGAKRDPSQYIVMQRWEWRGSWRRKKPTERLQRFSRNWARARSYLSSHLSRSRACSAGLSCPALQVVSARPAALSLRAETPPDEDKRGFFAKIFNGSGSKQEEGAGMQEDGGRDLDGWFHLSLRAWPRTTILTAVDLRVPQSFAR